MQPREIVQVRVSWLPDCESRYPAVSSTRPSAIQSPVTGLPPPVPSGAGGSRRVPAAASCDPKPGGLTNRNVVPARSARPAITAVARGLTPTSPVDERRKSSGSAAAVERGGGGGEGSRAATHTSTRAALLETTITTAVIGTGV